MAKKQSSYQSPFTFTSPSINLISEISEALGTFSSTNQFQLTPVLRRGNRVKNIKGNCTDQEVI